MQYIISKDPSGRPIVSYDCERCERELRSPLEDAGDTGACPQCGQPFVVPGIAELEAQSHAEAERKRLARIAAGLEPAGEPVTLDYRTAGRWPVTGGEEALYAAVVKHARSVKLAASIIFALAVLLIVIGAIGVVAGFGLVATGSPWGEQAFLAGAAFIFLGVLVLAGSAFFTLVASTCEMLREHVIARMSNLSTDTRSCAPV